MNFYFFILIFILHNTIIQNVLTAVNIVCIFLSSRFCWVYEDDGVPVGDFSFGFTGSCKFM